MVDSLIGSGQSRIAISVDARSAALPALPENLARIKARGLACQVLFLEAGTQTLLRRFSETRRSHPLATGGLTLADAIHREREMLASVAELGHRVDTSGLQPKVLQNWIIELLELETDALTVLFESFAFREGIPLDADWVLDSRMLPNPHYDPDLRSLTGQDAPVSEFLARDPLVQRWLADAAGFLHRWLPEVVRDNRSYLTVAVGCTGGQHRSVYLVERLADAFREKSRVLVRHRGLAGKGPQ